MELYRNVSYNEATLFLTHKYGLTLDDDSIEVRSAKRRYGFYLGGMMIGMYDERVYTLYVY